MSGESQLSLSWLFTPIVECMVQRNLVIRVVVEQWSLRLLVVASLLVLLVESDELDEHVVVLFLIHQLCDYFESVVTYFTWWEKLLHRLISRHLAVVRVEL